MGGEPIEEEIPIEYEDLFLDVQEAIGIYSKLRDEWDMMNGNYLGKNYAGITEIFQMLEIPREDWKSIFNLIGIIDKHRAKSIKDSTPKK